MPQLSTNELTVAFSKHLEYRGMGSENTSPGK